MKNISFFKIFKRQIITLNRVDIYELVYRLRYVDRAGIASWAVHHCLAIFRTAGLVRAVLPIPERTVDGEINQAMVHSGGAPTILGDRPGVLWCMV